MKKYLILFFFFQFFLKNIFAQNGLPNLERLFAKSINILNVNIANNSTDSVTIFYPKKNISGGIEQLNYDSIDNKLLHYSTIAGYTYTGTSLNYHYRDSLIVDSTLREITKFLYLYTDSNNITTYGTKKFQKYNQHWDCVYSENNYNLYSNIKSKTIEYKTYNIDNQIVYDSIIQFTNAKVDTISAITYQNNKKVKLNFYTYSPAISIQYNSYSDTLDKIVYYNTINNKLAFISAGYIFYDEHHNYKYEFFIDSLNNSGHIIDTSSIFNFTNIYDAKNNLISQELYMNQQPQSKYIFNYDNSNRLIDSIYQNYNNINAYINNFKMTLSYNQYGKIDSAFYYTWNTQSSTWILNKLITFEYQNINNKIVVLNNYIFRTYFINGVSNLTPSLKSLFTYSNFGNLLSEKYYNYNLSNSTWNLNNFNNYYWQSYLPSTILLNNHNPIFSVNAFPLPFQSSQNVIINSTKAGECNFKLFDLLGRLQFQITETVNIGFNTIQLNYPYLSNGNYLLNINLQNERTILKVTKD